MSTKIYNILNESGDVLNSIVADEEFMQQHYPNANYIERPEPAISIARMASKENFRFRFTTEEYTALLLAAKTDVEVQVWVETFNICSEINLDDPYVIQSIDMMVNKNIIAPHRKYVILSNDGVAPLETP